MRWWPSRTSQQRKDDTIGALWELGVSCGMLAVGCLFVLGGGYLSPNHSWMFMVGGLICLVSIYAIGQSLFGLLIEISVGAAGAMVVLGFAILGFMIFQGYGLLVE